MKKYAEYKDSGLPYLPKLPIHWDRTQLKRVLSVPITDGPHETPELLDEGIPFLSAEAVKNLSLDFELKRGYISEEDHKRFCLKCKPQYGDIFMVKSGATTGNVAMVTTHEEFSVWSPLALIRSNPTKVHNEFLFQLLQSPVFRMQVELFWSYGTQQNIGMVVLGNQYVILPLLCEQKAIARMLSAKLEKIDALLADLQSQVEMLGRYKRELIAETVTKGLNKLTTMKDSGVEWIGEIPSHWELIKARWVFRQSNSKGNENEVLLSATQKFGMFPQDEIEGTVKVKADTDLQSFKTVHKNDFVISLRSFQGGFEISDYEGVCSPAYQVFYNATPICHRFYKWFFKSVPFIDKMNSITTGIREGRNIPYEAFAQSLIPVPPIIEQEEIAQHLDTRLTLIDGLVTDITAQIEKLKQYRQIVIHDAVTGKIKVTEG